jgi:hypothetical protein
MGNRNKRRENYIYEGLLYPNRRVKHPGRRAAQYEPAPDTDAREAIITPYLGQGHSYRETAHELILHGFTPPRALDLRAFLLDFCDAFLKALSPYARKREGEHLDPRAYRSHITRRVRRAADAFAAMQDKPSDTPTLDDLDARDFPIIMALAANGSLPKAYHGNLMPPHDLYNIRRMRDLVINATDARLFQVYADAREMLPSDAEALAKKIEQVTAQAPDWLGRYLMLPLKDLVRFLLPGHHCATQHTLAQAMLPHAVIALLDPSASSGDSRDLSPAFDQMMRGVITGLESLIQ